MDSFINSYNTANKQRQDMEALARFRQMAKQAQLQNQAMQRVQPSYSNAPEIAPRGLSLQEQLNNNLITPDQYREAIQYGEGNPPHMDIPEGLANHAVNQPVMAPVEQGEFDQGFAESSRPQLIRKVK